jgi:hypothetical protein
VSESQDKEHTHLHRAMRERAPITALLSKPSHAVNLASCGSMSAWREGEAALGSSNET